WGRAGNDTRNRFFTGANVRLPWAVSLTTQINWISSQPYNITTGADDNLDKVINDRPTDIALCQKLNGNNCGAFPGLVIARNTGIGPTQLNIQMNVQKTVRLKGADKSAPSNRAGNGSPNAVNNFVEPQRGGGNFPGGGQRGGGDFGGQRGG